jgi:hypothetical protein
MIEVSQLVAGGGGGDEIDEMSMFSAMFSDPEANLQIAQPPITKAKLIDVYAQSVSETLTTSSKSNKKVYLEEARDILKVRTSSPKALEFIANSTDYITARGFVKNTFSLNGIITMSSEIGLQKNATSLARGLVVCQCI